ncbi:MAG: NPCBM/NEW2 domain-containing protein [Planctomycetes bacterium]|nr:NPCBM/NEW2 domain-containing protein [Planctomycetota bacterium]
MLDGSRAMGRFEDLGERGLRFAIGEDRRQVPLDELIALVFDRASIEPASELAEIEFANGARWKGHLRGGRGEELLLALGAHAELALPYGSYRRVEVLARTRGKGAIAAAGGESDRVYRLVGDALDVVDGIVTGYDEVGVTIEDGAGRERKIAWKETAALLFGSAESTWTLGEQSATVRLRDGCSARGTLLDAAPGVVALGFGEGARLELAPSEIWSVELHGPRFVRLGELAPAKSELTPFFEDGPAPFFVVDRGLFGAPLRIGGKVHARGLALRPICDLHYDLGGSYRSFRTRVGIDDACEPERHRDESWYGTVRFRIEVDGKEAWASPIVRAGQAALVVPPIDLRGARTLVLRTDFADGLPAGDLPVWIEPLLLR